MSDFHQSGVISTLPILGDKGYAKIEEELNGFSKKVKTSVVIPALHSDYVRPAMKHIWETLESVRFVHQTILALSGAGRRQFQDVLAKVRNSSLKITVLWMDNPRLRRLFRQLEKSDLYLGPDGKGKSCWASFGLVLAQGDSDVVALHDSDIKTYSKEMLARLIYPVVSPHMTYTFSKAYYARYADKMHGRVTRLFITPLYKSIEQVIGGHPYIHYLNSFRYPLAGELALDINLCRVMRFPGDWGLEVTTLYEIYRNIALKRICQVEITERYDHKHQSLSSRDAHAGLHKMVNDISLNVLKNLAAEGVILSVGILKTIQKNYLKIAEDIIANYHAIAMINAFDFDRHEEETHVETFYRALIHSCERFMSDPLGPRMLPNWSRITSAYPDFPANLLQVVEEDNR